MLRRSWPVLIVLLLVLLFLWWVRPIFHGLVMFFYTSPIVWLPPIVILAIGFGIRRFRGSKLSKRDLELLTGRGGDEADGSSVASLPSVGAGVGVIAGLAFVAFVLGAAFKAPLTNRAIYNNTDYASIGGLPEGGVVRLDAAGGRGPDRLQRLQLADREADRLPQRRDAGGSCLDRVPHSRRRLPDLLEEEPGDRHPERGVDRAAREGRAMPSSRSLPGSC